MLAKGFEIGEALPFGAGRSGSATRKRVQLGTRAGPTGDGD